MANPHLYDPNEAVDPLDSLLDHALVQVEEHALIVMDKAGLVVGWLCGAERIFGYTREEMLGQTLHRLFTLEDREFGIPEHELDIAAKNGRGEDDRWQLRKNQTRVWLSGAVTSLRDQNRRPIGFVKVARDRTDLRAQVETLENQITSLRKSNEHLKVFLGTLAHELRNPLAPLTNAIDLFRMSSPSSAEFSVAQKIVERQTENIRRLVDDLGEVTRIGAGKARLNVRPINLEEAIAGAVECCRPLLEERGHHLEVIFPRGSIVIEGDLGRLQQVFTNLLTNAAKYTDDGGRIWIKATIEDGEAVVRIRDTGVGISVEMLPHIFELFTQVESSLPRAAGGMGIGLSLVKDLVSLHNGSVQVRSEGEGKGTEFAVRLPLRQPDYGAEE